MTDGEGSATSWNITPEDIANAALLLASLTPHGRAAKLAVTAVNKLGSVGKKIVSAAQRLRRTPSAKPIERPKNIPKDWVKLPSRKKEGIKFVDPRNRGNDIRIQKGEPTSPYRNQRKDYVRWKRNGQWLDKYGRPSNDPEKTHIPLEEFNFDLEIF